MITFNKSKILAAISLVVGSVVFYSSSSITNNNNLKEKIVTTTKYEERRHLVSDSMNTILSSLLKVLFESPLSLAPIKTASCFAAFYFADVDFGNTARYDDWFNDDSVLELYAGGKYYGLDGIKEYANFIYSDDFVAFEALSDLVLFSEITKESDKCNITYAVKRRIPMTGELFPADTCYEVGAGATASFSITGDSKFVAIDKMNSFFPEAFITSLFGGSYDGAFAERVCTIMEASCPTVWAENAYDNQTDCQASINVLLITDGAFFDGRSQGCRWVHSAFATTNNEDHCEHISTIPLEDVNGNIKCQSSAGNDAVRMTLCVSTDG